MLRGTSHAFRSNNLQYALVQANNEYTQLDEEIKSIQAQLPLLAERANVAKKSKEVSKAKLRLGRVSFLELQQAEQAVFSASQDYTSTLARKGQLTLQKQIAIEISKDVPRMVASCRLRD